MTKGLRVKIYDAIVQGDKYYLCNLNLTKLFKKDFIMVNHPAFVIKEHMQKQSSVVVKQWIDEQPAIGEMHYVVCARNINIYISEDWVLGKHFISELKDLLLGEIKYKLRFKYLFSVSMMRSIESFNHFNILVRGC